MKKLSIIISLILLSYCSHSQGTVKSIPTDSIFLRSVWGGTVHMPDEVPVLIEFSNDTLFFFINDQLVESMICKKKGNIYELKKLNGASPCDDETTEYELILTEERRKLMFKAIKDKCLQRAMGLGNNNIFTRL
jgi:hypothetical protein